MVSLEGMLNKIKDPNWGFKTKAFAKYAIGGAVTAGAVYKAHEFITETGLDNLTYITAGAGIIGGTIGYMIALNSEKKEEKSRINKLKKSGTLKNKLKYDKDRFPLSYSINEDTDIGDITEILNNLKKNKKLPDLRKVSVRDSIRIGLETAYNESIEDIGCNIQRYVVLEKDGIGSHDDSGNQPSEYSVKIYETFKESGKVWDIKIVKNGNVENFNPSEELSLEYQREETQQPQRRPLVPRENLNDDSDDDDSDDDDSDDDDQSSGIGISLGRVI